MTLRNLYLLNHFYFQFSFNYLLSINIPCRKIFCLYSITIGIPSFNEEKNITRLLDSILIQHIQNFEIKEVLISDDSTDNTPGKIEVFTKENPELNVILLHHSTRRGTSFAWNEIFKQAKGDVVILFDADVILDKNCISKIISTFENDGQVDVCATNPIPFGDSGKYYRAGKFISDWLRSIRQEIISHYTLIGRGIGIKNVLAKKIRIPEDIIAIDLYLHCKCLDLNKKIVYNDEAVVKFQTPDNLRDFLSQIIRANAGHDQLKDCIKKIDENLAKKTFVNMTMKNLLKDPLGGLSMISCVVFLPYYKFIHGKKIISSKWEIAQSTK